MKQISREMIAAGAAALNLSCTVTESGVELRESEARGESSNLGPIASVLHAKFGVPARLLDDAVHIESYAGSYAEAIATIGALEHAVAHAIRPRHVEFGIALRAAQETHARLISEARAANA